MENVTCVFFKTADARPTLADIREAVADIPKLHALVSPSAGLWAGRVDGVPSGGGVPGLRCRYVPRTWGPTPRPLGAGDARWWSETDLHRHLALQWLDGHIIIIYHNDDIEHSAFASEVERASPGTVVKGIIYHLGTAKNCSSDGTIHSLPHATRRLVRLLPIPALRRFLHQCHPLDAVAGMLRKRTERWSSPYPSRWCSCSAGSRHAQAHSPRPTRHGPRPPEDLRLGDPGRRPVRLLPAGRAGGLVRRWPGNSRKTGTTGR